MTMREIRSLTLMETATLIDWAAAEGWNPGLADAAPFHAADPAGFVGCFVDGVLAAGISAVRYGDDFGFIGLYICKPEFRGKGHGKAVWDAGVAHLEGRTIGLDGVPAQQGNYALMGFAPLYETWRWSGRLPAMEIAPGIEVRPVQADDIASLGRYDRRHFPGPREAFTRQWVAPPRQAHVLIRNGAVAGYAVARACRQGWKIGPLFADDADGALALMSSLASVIGADMVQIDVPEGQGAFSAWLAQAGFEKSFVTARMYRGAPPAADFLGIFAVTSLELG